MLAVAIPTTAVLLAGAGEDPVGRTLAEELPARAAAAAGLEIQRIDGDVGRRRDQATRIGDRMPDVKSVGQRKASLRFASHQQQRVQKSIADTSIR